MTKHKMSLKEMVHEKAKMLTQAEKRYSAEDSGLFLAAKAYVNAYNAWLDAELVTNPMLATL